MAVAGRGASAVTRFDMATGDPEVAHHQMKDVYCDFDVRVSGSADEFAFSHAGLVAPRCAVTRMSYSMAVDLEADPMDALTVVTCHRGRVAAGSGRDSVVGAPGLPILMPSHGSRWWFSMAELAETVVTVDRAVVGQVAAGVFGLEVGELSFVPASPTSPASIRYWHRLVEHLQQDVLRDDDLVSNPLVLAEAARALAVAALHLFSPSGADREEDGADAGWVEPAALRRAVEYIEENASADIGVDDIAAAARLTVRGVQAVFRRHRHSTPRDYLRRVRMARAHADLQASDPTHGATVAAIAARWGFTNAGRFAGQYRAAYGCSPRETLWR